MPDSSDRTSSTASRAVEICRGRYCAQRIGKPAAWIWPSISCPICGIQMVGASQHEDAGPRLARTARSAGSGSAPHPVIEGREGPVPGLDHRGRIDVEDVTQGFLHLVGHEARLAQGDERGHVQRIPFRAKRSPSFQEARLILGPAITQGAAYVPLTCPAQGREGERIDERAQRRVDLLALAEEQLSVVPAHALDRMAAVHGPALPNSRGASRTSPSWSGILPGEMPRSIANQNWWVLQT